MKRMNVFQIAIGGVATCAFLVRVAVAHEVLPEIGGGHGAGASMIHAAVSLTGTTLTVELDPPVGESMDHGSMDHDAMDHDAMDHDAMDHDAMDHDAMDRDAMHDGSMNHGEMGTSGTVPLLRPLQVNHAFGPDEPWAVLADKAHNFQYGWVASGLWAPPAGGAVWIEPLETSPGLEVYEGGQFMSEDTVRAMRFEPIFGTDGSSPSWSWNGMMTHNAYAVANPQKSSFHAKYRVYMGDGVTGEELRDPQGTPLYNSAMTTFHFSAVPVPEPASVYLLVLALLLWVCPWGRL